MNEKIQKNVAILFISIVILIIIIPAALKYPYYWTEIDYLLTFSGCCIGLIVSLFNIIKNKLV